MCLMYKKYIVFCCFFWSFCNISCSSQKEYEKAKNNDVLIGFIVNIDQFSDVNSDVTDESVSKDEKSSNQTPRDSFLDSSCQNGSLITIKRQQPVIYSRLPKQKDMADKAPIPVQNNYCYSFLKYVVSFCPDCSR